MTTSSHHDADIDADAMAGFIPGHDIEQAAIAGFEARLQALLPRAPLRMPVDENRLRLLLERVSQGDAEAFTALYDETSRYLYAVLLRMLRDPGQADEALQDCYIRIWRRGSTYAPERGDAAGWLIGIARYRAIDVVRSRQAQAERLSSHASDLRDAAVPPRSPEFDAIVLTDIDRLSRCLDTMDDAHRRCLLLSFYEGYSNQELADHLGLPLGTVKARIRRALVRLRQCLEVGR
ncbi:MAG: sigma-70 family RNA polymerase sigma factor [Gammaproteobacteria bacterium]|nr:sigma-70 family RNA polymerase sigma factor [Gammaproteobacteria bacterium]